MTDETPGPVATAATSGDELELLKALRDKLAAAIEDCPVRDLSPLTRRLQDTVKEIREIEERRAKESGENDGTGAGGKWNPADDL